MTPRQLLKCLAVPLLVAQVGCAARPVDVAPVPPPLSISDQDRERCRAYARRRSEEVGSVAQAAIVHGFWYAIYTAADADNRNVLAKRHVYDAAEELCLRPVILAHTLGPNHPDVAVALRDLANDYAYHEDYGGAQPLYRRALEIQERAFGPESADVTTTLEWYGRLLRAMHRDEEAAYIEARAQTIRAHAEQGQAPEAEVTSDAPAKVVQPPPAVSAPIPPPVNATE
jgi:hypothetical protein